MARSRSRPVFGHTQLDDAVSRMTGRSTATSDGCWVMNRGLSGNGYSQVSVGGRPRLGHIIAWLLLRGEIPDGLELDHFHCNTPACWNPWHVEPVTHAVNMRRSRVQRYGEGPRPTPPSWSPEYRRQYVKARRQENLPEAHAREAAYRASHREEINARIREWKRRDRDRKRAEREADA